MKKELEYDKIIEYIKTVEQSETLNVHYYETPKVKAKEIYFRQTFTAWLKEEKIYKFKKYDFNYYCKHVKLIDITYRGKGDFVYYIPKEV